jgi:hypothetical protein
MSMVEASVIRAPRGNALRCKGWQQEAALRCLMNNLDPEVADRLREGGFSVDRVLVEDLRPVPAVCVKGRPHPVLG